MEDRQGTQEILIIQVNRRSVDVAFGKLVIIAALGVLIGYGVWVRRQSEVAWEPTSGFVDSLAFSIIIAIIMCAMAAGAYELLGRAIGWVISRIRGSVGS